MLITNNLITMLYLSIVGYAPITVCKLVELEVFQLCDNKVNNSGCASMTTVPPCVYNAPNSELVNLNSSNVIIGNLQSSGGSTTTPTEDAAVIASVSVLLCIAFLLLVRYLVVTAGAPLTKKAGYGVRYQQQDQDQQHGQYENPLISDDRL